ncbi:hypothetical protein YC2023_011581 [Brassica napus]
MEAHSAATKKNKEWQEKLSVVVFKADEIMYSKSNSENLADFGGLTLTTETGPLLPPCVEAALNLGCTAVRASISQRHSNVQTYLCPKFQQPVSASTNEPQYHHQAQKSNKPSPTAQPAISVDVLDDSNNRGAAFLHESMQNTRGFHCSSSLTAPINLGLVYPLYYRGNNQTQQVDMSSRVPIIIGMPISIKAPEERTERLCDLSLRLGVSSDSPSTRIDVGSSTRSYRGRNQEELCLFSEEMKKYDSFSNYQGQHSDSRLFSAASSCYENGEDIKTYRNRRLNYKSSRNSQRSDTIRSNAKLAQESAALGFRGIGGARVRRSCGDNGENEVR